MIIVIAIIVYFFEIKRYTLIIFSLHLYRPITHPITILGGSILFPATVSTLYLFFSYYVISLNKNGGIYTDIKELNWLRSNSHKLDPELRTELFAYYRLTSKVPCFLQRFFRFFKDKFKRFPVIIQLTPMRDHNIISEIRSIFQSYTKKSTDLKIINSFSTSLSIHGIKAITGHPGVTKVYLDREIRALLDVAGTVVNSSYLWNKQYTGKGITIAVLDTGVYPHPDLLLPENRIVVFKDFVYQKESAIYDDNGHGTHCIGAAAGNGHSSAGKYRGPAYEANIAAIKILNKMGTGNSSTAIKALEWVKNNYKIYNIRIVSLSLGYKAAVSYRDDPLCQALEIIWNSGIVVCTAAGNEGPEPKTIDSPGIDPNLITVGALNDKNTINTDDDVVADFSSRGPTIDGLTKPDFILPGENIISARAKDSFLDIIVDKNNVVDD
jgi:serine protease AprX